MKGKIFQRKKNIRNGVVLALLALCLLPLQMVMAKTTGTVRLSTTSTIATGQTFTLNLSLNGSNIRGVEAKLRYDTAQMELVEFSASRTDWTADYSGNKIVAYGVNNPVSTSATVGRITFRVKDGLTKNTALSVSLYDVSVSDGDSDTVLAEYIWTGTVAQMTGDLNGNNRLDVADATTLARYLMKKQGLTNTKLADMDGNGVVDKNDLQKLLRFAAHIAD